MGVPGDRLADAAVFVARLRATRRLQRRRLYVAQLAGAARLTAAHVANPPVASRKHADLRVRPTAGRQHVADPPATLHPRWRLAVAVA